MKQGPLIELGDLGQGFSGKGQGRVPLRGSTSALTGQHAGVCAPGGGRKVIRCELSLDGGETWRLADIERHEKPTAYNKYWCWVFWSVAVPGALGISTPFCAFLIFPQCRTMQWFHGMSLY